jgi:hypothetical protein
MLAGASIGAGPPLDVVNLAASGSRGWAKTGMDNAAITNTNSPENLKRPLFMNRFLLPTIEAMWRYALVDRIQILV